MTPKTAKLTDRERVLTHLLTWGPRDPIYPAHDGSPFWDTKPQPGDLVKCVTQRAASEWSFAYLVEGGGNGDKPHVLRAIGESRTVNMYNEMVWAARGMPAHLLLDRHQWQGYLKLYAALAVVINERGYDAPRFSAILYPDRETADATVELRAHSFLTRNGGSPVRIEAPRLHRLTRKAIVERISAVTVGKWWEVAS